MAYINGVSTPIAVIKVAVDVATEIKNAKVLEGKSEEEDHERYMMLIQVKQSIII